MTLATVAVVVATALTVAMLLPQLVKLARTGQAEGVSATWAAFGAVTNLAWTAYVASQGLWAAAPSTALVSVLYLVVLFLIVRTGRGAGRVTAPAAAAWVMAMAAVLASGGWAGLGLLLGLSYGVQVTPSLWTAYRTWAPRAIAPGTWAIGAIEAVPWGYYGWFHGDRALVLFGFVGLAASVLMLARYYGTRHRWREAAPMTA
ncbi:MAG: hypothetical protein ACRDVM_06100 [Acidimicrobiia bacterium]